MHPAPPIPPAGDIIRGAVEEKRLRAGVDWLGEGKKDWRADGVSGGQSFGCWMIKFFM